MLKASTQNGYRVWPIPFMMPCMTTISPKKGSENATSFSICAPRSITCCDGVNTLMSSFAMKNRTRPDRNIIPTVSAIAILL